MGPTLDRPHALPPLAALPRPSGDGAAGLQREAERHGFVVSWAAVGLPEAWRESYVQWIDEHRNAGVGQLARGLQTRLDPQERFSWAQSVMVLAVPQAYPDPGAPPDGLRSGQVARRFWVKEPEPFFLKRLLEPSIDALKAHAQDLGVRTRDYVDQGPLPGNLYAVSSGRFWRGRNAMPINPQLGTRITLAALLTDLPFDVPASAPHPDRCGSCRRCVDTCPTDALIGDRRIDLNRCVSFWTTTHQGLIPADMWDGIGTWLLGCDACQDVCPWNWRPERAEWAWEAFTPDPELVHPRLDDLVDLSAAEFSRRFADSAFERLGRARVVRNALIVLANSGDDRAPELLLRAADDDASLVRATAARGLARIGERVQAERLGCDPDPLVRAEALDALNGDRS
ncbi:MAG: 4Fe-4S ferredoxin iron-sulfur binding domain protein [Conexibacter sp.]|nr:4Fe-4S ferredoxin iron-sulfur binding domain protein [Conexibacter sp.]